MVSIRMVKLCGDSICRHLGIIFQACLDEDVFPDIRRKAKLVPVRTHKIMINSHYKTTDQSVTCLLFLKFLKLMTNK